MQPVRLEDAPASVNPVHVTGTMEPVEFDAVVVRPISTVTGVEAVTELGLGMLVETYGLAMKLMVAPATHGFVPVFGGDTAVVLSPAR